jgi:hypothetical protein
MYRTRVVPDGPFQDRSEMFESLTPASCRFYDRVIYVVH